MLNKENNVFYYIFALITGIFAAIGIAAVFFGGLIAAIAVLLYITLVVGILSLILIVFLVFANRRKEIEYFCINKSVLIPTTVGAIISSIFALALTALPVAFAPTAILVGVVAFFLVTTIINGISLVLCLLYNKKEHHCCE